MEFLSLSSRDAEGCILAHSVMLPRGRLRKGSVLNAQNCAELIDHGHDQVTVARLGPMDMHEDTAAAHLGTRVVKVADAFEISNAFTGRVNIIAKQAGIVTIDTDRLIKMNLVDPMITLATVPNFQQVAKGNLVGTVKIISYGVEKDALLSAADIGEGAISFAPVVRKTATLILTKVAGVDETKGVGAIESRLAALGITLTTIVTVEHAIDPLSRAIENAARQVDLVLILTASATSDAYDVAPQSVRAAGGLVGRFGMPVDPGNLLFLGSVESCAVIGLPGCARSPALNGADWVLSRVACGFEVTKLDFAQMSVGGLLKEIPTRPQPRRPKNQSKQ